MDDRYVDVQEASSSLQAFDTRIQQQITLQDNQLKMWQYDAATEEYYRLKRLQRMYPDDLELQDELKISKERRDDLKIKLKMEVPNAIPNTTLPGPTGR